MNTLSIEELKCLQSRVYAATLGGLSVEDGKKATAAIGELIAIRDLKGEQVPVAVVDIQHGRADGNLFAVTLTKAGHALKDDVYELFTAPQKPVVCHPDGIAKALHDCDWAGVSIGNKAIILAAIRALRAQPQKPVVSKQKLCNWLEEEFGVTESQYDSYASSFAESVGGIVKDGE